MSGVDLFCGEGGPTHGFTYPSVYGRMEWDKPAPTMTTQYYGFGIGRFWHLAKHRAISLHEAALLQNFPRAHKFVPPGDPVQFPVIGRLIGNAVPVRLGCAIACSIHDHLSSLDSRLAISKEREIAS